MVSQVSQDIKSWKLSTDKALDIVNRLQQRYLELTSRTQNDIESNFATIDQAFAERSVIVKELPLWAKKLGMVEPTGMQLDTSASAFNVPIASGTTTRLIYRWSYDLALQQAKAIAQQAHLFVTKNFQQAQSLAKLWNVEYISGLDIWDIVKWIVYVNHELLDTNIDQLLSVSVDKDGVLTIEATKYIK